jgi:hypothetical protein
MNTSYKAVIAGIALILMASVVVSSLQNMKRSSPQESSAPSAPVVKNTTPTTGAPPTSANTKLSQLGWREYRGKAFSFRYPSSWVVVMCHKEVDILWLSPIERSCDESSPVKTAVNFQILDADPTTVLGEFLPDREYPSPSAIPSSKAGIRVEPHINRPDQLLIPYVLDQVDIPVGNQTISATLMITSDAAENTSDTFRAVMASLTLNK